MTCSQLLAAALVLGGTACAHSASQPRTVGPVIGESTAQGPRDPTRPPPPPTGVTEVSAPIHGTPSPVANPAITVDTMPSTLEPSGNTSTTGGSPPVPVFSGTATGNASVGAAPGATTGTAGPNGPGTGNGRATPTGPATGGATSVNPPTIAPTTPPIVTPSNPAPVTPTAPTTPPSNGPGAGNTLNPPPAATTLPRPITPAPTPVSPR